MKPGGRRLLVIPGEQAYGPTPPPGARIAPNETLVFVDRPGRLTRERFRRRPALLRGPLPAADDPRAGGADRQVGIDGRTAPGLVVGHAPSGSSGLRSTAIARAWASPRPRPAPSPDLRADRVGGVADHHDARHPPRVGVHLGDLPVDELVHRRQRGDRRRGGRQQAGEGGAEGVEARRADGLGRRAVDVPPARRARRPAEQAHLAPVGLVVQRERPVDDGVGDEREVGARQQLEPRRDAGHAPERRADAVARHHEVGGELLLAVRARPRPP